jgi:tRNA A-37 threonylcarbamoyl transferase component Bud32/tetratricopeptide (TPR) repeat protein
MNRSECVTEVDIRAFVDDGMTAPELARMWAHAEGCEDCAARLQEAALADDQELHTRLLGEDGDDEIEEIEPHDGQTYDRGDPIGRYIVLEPIGAGGLGQVYAGYDPDLDRKVAIKVLRPEAKTSANATLHQIRLMREAKAMAKLTHPNVVAVYDVGIAAGQVFITMEFVDGVGLRQWVSAESPTWAEIRDAMLDAGKALVSAHAVGLVHRDFKPSNVMVTTAGDVKVLDFGLARNVATRDEAEAALELEDAFSAPDLEFTESEPLSRIASLDEPLTQSGQFMGTPGYMPPEQYDTRSLIDARSDQFAFCVTLHEVLYRRRPYRGKTFAEVKQATLDGEVAPPREGVKIPGWLRSAILRGIAPEPGDRFADMDELLAALDQDRRARKRQWLGAAAIAGASALLGGGIALFWSPEPVPAEVARVDALASEARDAAARSFYVYPPVGEPGIPTAYTKVVELEQVEGTAEALADTRAVELRGEFAGTLIRLGDRYWDEPGGRAFARDYYAEALIFVPESERARERVMMTPGQVAELERKAEAAEFSHEELVAAAPLAALAEDDAGRREERLREAYAAQDPSLGTVASLEQLLGEEATAKIVRTSSRARPRVAAKDDARPSVEPPTDDDDEEVQLDEDLEDDATAADDAPVPEPDPEVGDATDAGDAAGAAASNQRNHAKAQALVQDARRAFESNRLQSAASLFNRALDLEPGNGGALAGLAELEFERGRYREALRFGRKAVRKRSKDGSLRLLMGDIYYKTVDYPAARREYEAARKLGVRSAKARLRRLDEKVGK